MYTAKLKRGMAQDIALILGGTIAPKEVVDMKTMRILLKIGDKCEEQLAGLKEEQQKLDDSMKAYRARYAEITDEEEKKALNKTAEAEAKPFVDRMNEIREEECVIEFSDDQIDMLRKSFKKQIADNLKSAKYAVELADRLEVPDEEAK